VVHQNAAVPKLEHSAHPVETSDSDRLIV